MSHPELRLIDHDSPLHVLEILRDLPGRRRAIAARFGEERVFAKLFDLSGAGDRRADREVRRIESAARRGLRVAPLRGRTEAQEADGKRWACVLQDWIEGDAAYRVLGTGKEAREEHLATAHELFRAWGDLHARGLDQRDPQLGNVLRDADGPIFVDLGTVSPTSLAFGFLGWLRAGSLGTLFAQLDPSWWPRAEELLNVYAETSGRAVPTAAVGRAARSAWKAIREESRKKRLRACTDVEVRPLERGRLLLSRPSSRAASLGRFLAEPKATEPPEGVSFLRPGSLLQARRGWIDLWTLRRYGLPVAEPLALLEDGADSSLVVGGTARKDLPDAERIALIERARKIGRLRGVEATWENAPSLDARSGPCLGAWALAPRFFTPAFG